MDEDTPSLAAETEALRVAYAALNRDDIPSMASALDAEIEWIEPADYPFGGTHRGIAAVTALLTKARATWAEGSCEPVQFIPAGDKIVVFVDVRVRVKDRSNWIEARLADVYTFRDGKAIQMRHFPDRREALEWAGATASDPH